jgi:hypothetical protein
VAIPLNPWGLQDRHMSLPLTFKEREGDFDIAFALKKVTIPGFPKLKDEDRIAIAEKILEHLKLCRWEFLKPSDPSFKG